MSQQRGFAVVTGAVPDAVTAKLHRQMAESRGVDT